MTTGSEQEALHPVATPADVAWVELQLEAWDIKADEFGLSDADLEAYEYCDAWLDGYTASAVRLRRIKQRREAS